MFHKVILPSGFASQLNPFNAEVLNGGAFRLRAVGADSSGNIIRSREYMFFRNGMSSLFLQDEYLSEKGILVAAGYLLHLHSRQNGKGVIYWDVMVAQEQDFVHSKVDIPPEYKVLEVSAINPGDKFQILFGVEGVPGQYFYIRV